MAESVVAGTSGPSPDADVTGPDAEQGGWGRALDIAGGVAAVVLLIIAIDIFSDGKFISRRFHREPQPEDADGRVGD